MASDWRSAASSLCSPSNDQSLSFLICEIEIQAHNQFWGVKVIRNVNLFGIKYSFIEVEDNSSITNIQLSPFLYLSWASWGSQRTTATYTHCPIFPKRGGIWSCNARFQPCLGAPGWQKLASKAARGYASSSQYQLNWWQKAETWLLSL